MGTGLHGGFGDTKGQQKYYRETISRLPKNPHSLTQNGWNDVTPREMAQNTTSRMYQDRNSGLKVRFDTGTEGAGGYGGKDHYHVFNPNSTGKHDYYLDINGNPVPKNSKASHIIP